VCLFLAAEQQNRPPGKYISSHGYAVRMLSCITAVVGSCSDNWRSEFRKFFVMTVGSLQTWSHPVPCPCSHPLHRHENCSCPNATRKLSCECYGGPCIFSRHPFV